MLCTTGFESCHRSERCTCNADSAHKPGVRMHNVHTESGVGEWQIRNRGWRGEGDSARNDSFLTSSHSPSAATLPPSADSSSQTAAAPCLPVFVRSRQHPSIPSKIGRTSRYVNAATTSPSPLARSTCFSNHPIATSISLFCSAS